MSSKHTPGPWFTHVYGPHDHCSIGSDSLKSLDGKHIAIAMGITKDANAHLISAAPDLLAACEEILDTLTACGYGGNNAKTESTHIETLRAAIAKASGTK